MLANPYTNVQFLKSAAKMNQLPDDVGYEVAFAGRSNAGKSSALNCLTNVRQLARTSKTPGRTQLINIFSLVAPDRRLVDLPGYGYAKVSMAIKENWQKTLSAYLLNRACLRGLILLMDSRHPLTELDRNMLQFARNRQLPVHVLLTKADKLSRNQVSSAVLKTQAYCSEWASVQSFSSSKRQGLEILVQVLNDWFDMEEPEESSTKE